MNRTLILLLTLLSISSFGQEWNDYKFDDNLTIQIPNNYEVIDTLGQRVVKVQIDNALIMIQRIPNQGDEAATIRDKDDLIKHYTGFQKGFTGKQNGEVSSSQVIERDGLVFFQFSFNAVMGEEKQIRHCLGIFLNENWYAIQFWEVAEMTEVLKIDRERLFSSAKFPSGLGIKDQMSYSFVETPSYNAGYVIGQLLGYGLMIGLVIVGVRWIVKRGKKKRTKAQP